MIYECKRDGWGMVSFKFRVINCYSLLFIVKASNARVFGGYTSKSCLGSGEFANDDDAFVFSVDKNTKYTPSDLNQAIYKR
jgi:hypothetical protein